MVYEMRAEIPIRWFFYANKEISYSHTSKLDVTNFTWLYYLIFVT